MPERLVLRAWAIDDGRGNLLEKRGLGWCPALLFRTPRGANISLRTIRNVYPDARAVRVRVTIEDVRNNDE